MMKEKERLWTLIKLVGAFYGEPIETLKEYAKDVYESNLGDLTKAIKCFEELLEETKWFDIRIMLKRENKICKNAING